MLHVLRAGRADRHRRFRARPRRARACSRSSTPAAWARTGSPSTTTTRRTRTRRSSRRTTTTTCSSASSRRTRCVTWRSTRTTTCSRSPGCSTAGSARTRGFLFECDNPMDMQFGADGDFYLLTYGDGFFNINPDAGMYKWQYVKGQRAPTVGMSADRTDGPVPLTVNFSSAGTSDAGSGRLDLVRLGLRRRLRALDGPEPDARLHGARPLHRAPHGDRLVRQVRRAADDDHGR